MRRTKQLWEEGGRAKVGEIGKWDGVIPADHWSWSQGGSLVRVDVQIVPGVISKVSLKQLLTIQWCHRLLETWRGGESPAKAIWLLFLREDAKACVG